MGVWRLGWVDGGGEMVMGRWWWGDGGGPMWWGDGGGEMGGEIGVVRWEWGDESGETGVPSSPSLLLTHFAI